MFRITKTIVNDSSPSGEVRWGADFAPTSLRKGILKRVQDDKIKNCKRGFTLAEVLITLAIVGVVAALTMPTLVAHYKDKVLETQQKKAASVISNAFGMLKAETDGANLAYAAISNCKTTECFATELKKVLNIVADVDMTSDNAKMKYTFLNGEREVWSEDKHYVFATADGTVFGLEKGEGISSGVFSVVADVNGNKLPNLGGKDLCKFAVSNTATVTEQCSAMLNTPCEEGYISYNGSCTSLPTGCTAGTVVEYVESGVLMSEISCTACVEDYTQYVASFAPQPTIYRCKLDNAPPIPIPPPAY